MSFKMDWCSHKAAKFACENWHYSHSTPSGKTVKIGIWENCSFVGAVIFGSGATNNIGSPYGLTQFQICELVRVAIKEHQTPVSRILAVAIKMLKKHFRGIRLIVSYSDKNQNHHGGIYQASNWFYVGMAADKDGSVILHGKQVHGRSVGAKYGTRSIEYLKKHVDPSAKNVPTLGKHKYLMPLDSEMKSRIMKLAKPYPKRAGSKDIVAKSDQDLEGGENPTSALQDNDSLNGIP